MKTLAKHTASLILFWFLFFNIGRLYFLIYNWELWKDASWGEFIQLFFYGAYMDLAVISMFLAPVYLLSLPQLFSNSKWWYYLQLGYQGILVLIASIIAISEPELYYEWRSKLSQKALDHMFNHPDEVFKTATLSSQILGYTVLIVLLITAYFLLKKLYPRPQLKSTPWWAKLTYFLVMPVLIVIGMRGGIQPIPISQGDIYFSKTTPAFNAAAVNSIWNLGHSYDHNSKNGLNNPYKVMPEAEAKAIVHQSFQPSKDTTVSILKSDKPNLLFIILESWSADMVDKLGGYAETAPEFSKWSEKGMLFTNFIASGERSEQGMAAIYSGFPAQPHTNIFAIQAKSQNLPFLTHPFEAKGYSSSYTFGGDLSYANISSYMYQHKMQKIIEQSDFNSSVPAGRLGIHDEYVFNRLLDDLNQEKEPFFASMFTLSSHSPYDVPMEDEITFGGSDQGYLNSVRYADRSLGQFLTAAEQTEWYSNTLIVIMADHSHVTPKNNPYYSHKHHRVPMMMIGGALKDSLVGSTYDHYCSHQDLPKTLLKQFKDPAADQYYYSRDLFNPSNPPSFAYYTFNDGSGLISDSAQVSYNFLTKTWQVASFDSTWDETRQNNFKKLNQAYLQQVFQDYLDMDQFK